MLVLSRKENQSVIIGEGIEVTIARISRKMVRIGISAPRYVPIYRKELASCSNGNDKKNEMLCDNWVERYSVVDRT